MNEIERALATLQDLLDNSIFTSRIDFALEVAIEALREKAERENGCEYCDDDCCPRLNWHYGLAHILPGYKYCPMCGRKLDHKPKEARRCRGR